jgi:Cu(I)/Ag(I) efflux system membrane fusion protein
MNKNYWKITLTAGVLSVISLGFSACNSNEQKSATDTKQTENTATAQVVKVPDFASVDAGVKDQVAAVYLAYLQVKDNLVAGQADAAKAAAQQVVDAMEKVDATQLSSEQKAFYDQHAGMVKQRAQSIAGSGSVEEQRSQLDMFSTSTFSLVKAFKANDETLYLQHCPMANKDKGGYWISQTSEVKNPYFGDKMLKCGETRETLAQ